MNETTIKQSLNPENKLSGLKDNQNKGSSSSAGVVICSTEIVEEENKEATGASPTDSSVVKETLPSRPLDVARDAHRLCASNEFENEEKRDLQ